MLGLVVVSIRFLTVASPPVTTLSRTATSRAAFTFDDFR